MAEFGLLGALCLLFVTVVAARPSLMKPRECELPPDWKIDGKSPMQEGRGKVVVLALLKAS